MAALLLQLSRSLGRAARAPHQLLASPRLRMSQQARRDCCRRSAASSSAAAAEEEQKTRPPPSLPSPTNPLRVAVVGSGPAGCYAASELFKRLGESVRVDILDKLPTPFGLVRSGVAPDHQDTKNVTNQFERVLRDGRARFFGNVEVVGDGGGGRREEGGGGGGDGDGRGGEESAGAAAAAAASSSSPSAPLPVRLRDLRGMYHAVVLAHGAESATPLGLPLLARKKGKGSTPAAALPSLPSSPSSSGVVTARDFVLWANGHPELSESLRTFDLRPLRSAVVVGAGNVALDCARLLLRGKKELLEGTDASRRALSASLALDSSSSDEDEEEEGGGGERGGRGEGKASPLRTVHVVARRGAAQAAFSAKELREALSLPGVSVFIHHPPPFLLDDELDPADRAELAASRRAARVFDLLRRKAAEEKVESESGGKKELHFHFLRSPVELIAAAAEEEREEGGDASSAPLRVAAVRLVANRLETREGKDGRVRRVAVPVAAAWNGDGDGDGDGGGDGGDSVSASSSSSSSESTPTFLTLPAQLVIAALGFRTPSLGEGTPYDEQRGVVPSGGGGRVVFSPSPSSTAPSAPSSSSSSSSPAPPPPELLRGLYVTGWARRGPSGIIGENLRDAAEVADAVASDAAELMTMATAARVAEKDDAPSSSSSGLLSLLEELSSLSSSPRVVDVEGWARIDALEREGAAREVEERMKKEGSRRDRKATKGGGDSDASSAAAARVPPRVKILSAEELLRAAGV